MIFQTTQPRSISFEPCLAPPIKRILITKVVVDTINAGPKSKEKMNLTATD